MGVVHQSKGHLMPLSKQLLSEPAIVAGLAAATLQNSTTDWSGMVANYDFIRTKIEATIPGFQNYNQRVRIPGGFTLPNNAREGNFTPTATGKANFSNNKPSEITLEDHQFLMMTIRTHDQYNTTIYGLNDRYRGVLNERRIIFMNPDDMQLHGLQKLEKVNLISHFNDEKRHAFGFLVVPYNIPKQCTATYFPEANVLIPIKSIADISNTPTSKAIVISIQKETANF
jgi:anaerobic selenocysteine-containing dehydrogenase